MALDGLEAAIYASVAPTGLRRAPQSLHVAAHAACFFDETSFCAHIGIRLLGMAKGPGTVRSRYDDRSVIGRGRAYPKPLE
ncbi:hypothetical protein PTKU46_81980 [Paraburkholderia terrae]